ncbi:MAG: hypothetical protein KDH20_22410 [Rhodocyclaceae bacterium]|nr:hypothetical protein [Rhodocyclaceae bacterium]
MRNGLQYDNLGAYIEKGSGAALIYGLDWSRWLLKAGGLSIAAHAWSAEAGITVDPVSVVDGNKSYVRVSGGTAGADYWLTCTITLSDTPAQTETRSFRVRVVDRRAL